MAKEDHIALTPGRKSDTMTIQPAERNSLVGLLYIFVGVIIYSTSFVIIKELEEDGIPFLQLTFVRNVVVVLITGAFIVHKRCHGEKMRFFGDKGEQRILVIRAALYWGALNFYYWAFLYIPLGLVTVIGYSFPLFIAVVSHFGLLSDPEKLTKFGWFCNIVGFIGISITVSADDASGASVQGILLAALSTICWAIQVIIIRRTRSTAHWLQIEFVTGFVNVFVITPLVLISQWIITTIMHTSADKDITIIEVTTLQWGECILIGAVAFSAHACYTIGFQLEEAPRASIIMYLEIPVMYVAQWFAFRQGISVVEVCGVLVLIFGIVGATVERIMMEKNSRDESMPKV